MKKLSEVCKTLGVTRRSLQEYDKIGLLSPSARTEAGYWLYDDEAILKLYLIQIFVRLGYKRKDIARLIDNHSLDLMEEYQKAIYKLTEQRKEIDGMINMLRMNMILPQMPPRAFKALSELNLEDFLGDKNFAEGMNETIDKLKEVDTLEMEEAQPFVALGVMIAGIAFFRKYEVSSEEVQNYIEDLYDYMLELIAMDEDFTEEDSDFLTEAKEDPEIVSEMITQLMMMLNDQEYAENLDANYGEGTTEFAREALKFYVSQKGGNLNE